MIKKIGNVLIIVGVVFISVFAFKLYSHYHAQQESLKEAQEFISQTHNKEFDSTKNNNMNSIETKNKKVNSAPEKLKVDHMQAFGTLTIPKLDKTLAIVEGADEDALAQGVGHMSKTALPGQGEQIILSGHRDTVFRSFDQIEIGDTFVVKMPYGEYKYKIKKTDIVSANDTSVVGGTGEEALVVSTCYPFDYIGNAPDRFVTYAYPIKKTIY